MNTLKPSRFNQALASFDALNQLDPNLEVVAGKACPKELLYAQRMTAMLHRYVEDASEVLQLAVRCQHIERWKIPRTNYPMTKAGYHQWRNALKTFHAETAQAVLREADYDEDTISHVCQLVKKALPLTNYDAQTLEDVVVLVFLESYLEQFVASHSDYAEEKFLYILTKTLMKMSVKARTSISGLVKLPPDLEAIVNKLVV